MPDPPYATRTRQPRRAAPASVEFPRTTTHLTPRHPPYATDIAAPRSSTDALAPDATSTAEAVHAAAAPDAPLRDPLSIQRVSLCDAFGRSLDLAGALQDCIDRAAPFSIVELQPGLYELDRQLVITKPITIRTAGNALTTDSGRVLSCVEVPDRCAVISAAPDLLAYNGLVLVASTRNVTLEHVVIDGNRGARQASIAARFCLEGRTTAGFNASVLECTNCRLEDVVSRNALCGTAMAWSGRGALIQHSAFVDNGDAATFGMWSDGLTLLYAPDSEVRVNTLANNSDVALILGYAARSRIESNTIVQATQPAFAGLMLHNFGSDDVSFRGDFRDAVVTSNTVDCGPQMCVFGIQVGPRPWDVTRNIIGGDLHQNVVRGAMIGINADGAGTSRAPTRIFGNDVGGVPDGALFTGCADPIPMTWMNIAPTSAIDRHGEHLETAAHLSERCELSPAPIGKGTN